MPTIRVESSLPYMDVNIGLTIHKFKSFCVPQFPKSYPFCTLRQKVPKFGVFSGPYFAVFGQNTEIYSVNLGIQSKHRKIQTRKISVFGHFSCRGKLSTFDYSCPWHVMFLFLESYQSFWLMLS